MAVHSDVGVAHDLLRDGAQHVRWYVCAGGVPLARRQATSFGWSVCGLSITAVAVAVAVTVTVAVTVVAVLEGW